MTMTLTRRWVNVNKPTHEQTVNLISQTVILAISAIWVDWFWVYLAGISCLVIWSADIKLTPKPTAKTVLTLLLWVALLLGVGAVLGDLWDGLLLRWGGDATSTSRLIIRLANEPLYLAGALRLVQRLLNLTERRRLVWA